jgi:hypothetical protein
MIEERKIVREEPRLVVGQSENALFAFDPGDASAPVVSHRFGEEVGSRGNEVFVDEERPWLIATNHNSDHRACQVPDAG